MGAVVRRCSTCKEAKSEVDFYSAQNGRCKECQRAASRAHYHRNRERLALAAKERMARERQENGDRVRARERSYWSQPQNRERRRTQARAFHAQRTPEQLAQVRANWNRWKERNLERERARIREVQASRLARKLKQFVENVDPEIVVERDRGYCGICGLLVVGAYHIDHVIPLSRGGEHSYANTQLAHPRCNISKGARLPEELAAPF